MISSDNISGAPHANCLAYVTGISNPAVKRNKSLTACALAVSRAVLTANNDAFDATVTREIIAEHTTINYNHQAGGFIVTGIANIKHTLMGLSISFHCPDTGTDYTIKIREYETRNTGNKRNKTAFKATLHVKPGTQDAINSPENTAIVAEAIKDFLARGNCELLDVRRGGNGIVVFPYYHMDFQPYPNFDLHMNTLMAGRDGLYLPSGYSLYIKWDGALLEKFKDLLCTECLYERCACGRRPGSSGGSSRLSKAARLARYD